MKPTRTNSLGFWPVAARVRFKKMFGAMRPKLATRVALLLRRRNSRREKVEDAGTRRVFLLPGFVVNAAVSRGLQCHEAGYLDNCNSNDYISDVRTSCRFGMAV